MWNDAASNPPPRWGVYLVYRDSLNGMCMDVATYYPEVEKWGSWQALGHKIGDCVQYWMPLPEPPNVA